MSWLEAKVISFKGLAGLRLKMTKCLTEVACSSTEIPDRNLSHVKLVMPI